MEYINQDDKRDRERERTTTKDWSATTQNDNAKITSTINTNTRTTSRSNIPKFVCLFVLVCCTRVRDFAYVFALFYYVPYAQCFVVALHQYRRFKIQTKFRTVSCFTMPLGCITPQHAQGSSKNTMPQRVSPPSKH